MSHTEIAADFFPAASSLSGAQPIGWSSASAIAAAESDNPAAVRLRSTWHE
jgi:hypothetical protein